MALLKARYSDIKKMLSLRDCLRLVYATRIKKVIKKVSLTTSHDPVKWFIIFAYHRDGGPLSDPHVRNWCKNNIQGHSDRACSRGYQTFPIKLVSSALYVYIELIVSTIRGTSKYRNASTRHTFPPDSKYARATHRQWPTKHYRPYLFYKFSCIRTYQTHVYTY